jgi:hypothetical protein
VDADSWSTDNLLKVFSEGEALLNVQFPAAFKLELIKLSLNSVHIVQDCCYKACKENGVVETTAELFVFARGIKRQEACFRRHR